MLLMPVGQASERTFDDPSAHLSNPLSLVFPRDPLELSDYQVSHDDLAVTQRRR